MTTTKTPGRRVNDLSKLEDTINIHFKDQTILQNALVHRSYHNEHKHFNLPSNEKLEFLGDSVLSLVTSLHLYTEYPDYQEGDYTDIKASIVNTVSLYEAARDINLGAYLYLSKGEQDNSGRDNMSILADAFEAVIGAIYLTFGFDKAYAFVREFLFKDRLDTIISEKLYLPAKNILQEYFQEKYKQLPEYKIIEETGPEHDKSYKAAVFNNGTLVAQGEGRSKKQAEEDSARNALQKLGI